MHDVIWKGRRYGWRDGGRKEGRKGWKDGEMEEGRKRERKEGPTFRGKKEGKGREEEKEGP
jgi:hypothetical protein